MGTFDESSGTWNGAIGALYDGLIDLVAMPSYYPQKDPLNRFLYSPLLYEDTINILSGYNVSSTQRHGDLITLFKEIPLGIWIMYIASFFTFLAVSYIGSMVLKKSFSSLWMTICAFLDQDNYPTVSKFLSTLSIFVMVSMFFFMNYATNLIGTDLVTTESPVTLTTYDEIIERNVTALIPKVMPVYERFQSAPNGTKEQILFANSEDLKLEPGSADKLKSAIVDQSVVMLARAEVAYCAALIALGFPGLPEQARAYLAPDPQAKKYTNVFLLDSRLKGTYEHRQTSQV